MTTPLFAAGGKTASNQYVLVVFSPEGYAQFMASALPTILENPNRDQLLMGMAFTIDEEALHPWTLLTRAEVDLYRAQLARRQQIPPLEA